MMFAFFNNLIKSVFVYGLGAIAGPIIGFFLIPIYTRFLTPSDYGILETLATTTSIIAIFLIFGMDNSLFRFSFDSKDDTVQKRVLSTTSVFLWTLAIIVTILLVTNASFFSQLLFNESKYTNLLIIAFLSAAIVPILKIPMSVYRIHNQPRKYISLSVVQTILTASLCILFVVGLRKGVFGIMAGSLISAVVVTLIAYYLTKSYFSFDFSIDLLKKMLRFAIPIIPAGLSLWILHLSDRYFLLAYTTTTEVGLYSIGAKLASIVGLAIMAFNLAWPQAAFSILDDLNRNKLYARTLTYFIFTGCSIALVVSLFSNELVRLMTTEQFWGAATVIPLLAFGLVFNGCYTILAIGMNITKKMAMLFPVTALPAILNLILNYFLVPPYGMMGSAWATLISYLLMALLSWWASERVHHIDYEWVRIAKIFSVTLAILGVNMLVVLEQPYFSIPAKLGLIALYVAILYVLKFPGKDEYGSLKKVALGLYPRSHKGVFATKNELSPKSRQDAIDQVKDTKPAEKS